MTTLPASPDAERRLVAAVFVDDGHTLGLCLARKLCSAHFADPDAGVVFGIACDLYRDRRPITGDAFGELLKARQVPMHEIVRLSGVMGTVSTTAQAADDLETVLSHAALREALVACGKAAEIGKEQPGTPAERLEAMMPHLRHAQEAGTPSQVRDLASIAENAANGLESPTAPGLPGPFPAWDRLAGALRPGELSVLAARPGLGKTALATQHAGAALHHDKPCVMFSLEMTGEELCERMARQALGANAGRGELASWIRSHLKAEKRLTIYDGSAGASIAQIEARTRLHAASRRGLGLVIVDYLQLIAPPVETRRENRERQVAAISRALKSLALELRIPVLLLSQLNREVEKEDRRPRLSDLRESGAIEQDADAVWFLHLDATGPQFTSDERAKVLLIQAKRRNGPSDVALSLEFHRPAVRFTPMAATH